MIIETLMNIKCVSPARSSPESQRDGVFSFPPCLGASYCELFTTL